MNQKRTCGIVTLVIMSLFSVIEAAAEDTERHRTTLQKPGSNPDQGNCSGGCTACSSGTEESKTGKGILQYELSTIFQTAVCQHNTKEH